MGDIVKESVKYVFTEKEILEISSDMAKASIEVDRLTTELKDISAQYKGNISAETAKMKNKANLIKDGYEYRYTDCRREFEHGNAVFYNLETGEKIKERLMTPEERQLKI